MPCVRPIRGWRPCGSGSTIPSSTWGRDWSESKWWPVPRSTCRFSCGAACGWGYTNSPTGIRRFWSSSSTWSCGTRPCFRRSTEPLDGEAVVVIDEVDLHLHVRWQRTVLQQLARTIPQDAIPRDHALAGGRPGSDRPRVRRGHAARAEGRGQERIAARQAAQAWPANDERLAGCRDRIDLCGEATVRGALAILDQVPAGGRRSATAAQKVRTRRSR